MRRLAGALLALAAACQPHTTRPPFGPVTGAVEAELRLTVPRATEALAEALRADGIPVTRVHPRDGWLETSWFDTASLGPTSGRRLGPEVVRVRAWADPTRPYHSRITVETLFRPLADPSLPERELDRQVPPDHPVGERVRTAVSRLIERFGEPVPIPEGAPGNAPGAVPADTTPPDTTPADTAPAVPGQEPADSAP